MKTPTLNRIGRLTARSALIALLAMSAGARAQLADTSLMQSGAAIEPTASIQRAAERTIRTQAGSAGAALIVQADPLDSRLRLAGCSQPLGAFVTGDGQLRAQTTVGVRCEAPVHWTIYVNVKVESESNVLIARRSLSRDTELAASDFEVSNRRVPGVVTNYVTDASALGGQRLRRAVSAGEALQLDALTPVNLIHRGQQVVLIARAGSIEVRMAAVALADGRVSDRIRVQNLASQRVVEGIVRSDNVVEAPL